MADNFLEKHYEQYEERKRRFINRRSHLPKSVTKHTEPNNEPNPTDRPEDEAAKQPQ